MANVFPRPPASAVTRLLTEAGLPSSDVTEGHLKYFFGCGSGGAPEGIVGIELYGPVALLRSLAVSEKCRGQGCGTALVAQAEQFARSRRVEAVYLLTATAASFFERLGYARAKREAAPLAIQRTQEFSALCSSSATLMVKRLQAEEEPNARASR